MSHIPFFSTHTTQGLISYALLAFCLSFIGLPIYIYLPSYYADNFSLSLQTIAVILFVTRLVDTIQDPLFGLISDRFAHLKRYFICYLSPFLGLSFLLLFYPLHTAYIEWWLCFFLIITYSLFSAIYINYQSFAVELSSDYHLKTKIISYREFSFITGIICAASAPAILFNYMSEPKAFLFIGMGYVLIISLFAFIFFRYAPAMNNSPSAGVQEKNAVQSWKYLHHLFKDKSLVSYFVVFILNAFASSIPAVLILFFVDEILGAKSYTGLFLVLYFVGLMGGVVLWSKLSVYLNNKVNTFIIAIFSSVLLFSWSYFLSEGDVWLYALICIGSGITFGGDLALSYSILTDFIQKKKLHSHQTTLFGISNFLLKLSLTLSSSILIYILGSLDYNLHIKQQFISVSYVIIPMIFRISAGIILYKKRHLFNSLNAV